jgi:hypothetical protein
LIRPRHRRIDEALDAEAAPQTSLDRRPTDRHALDGVAYSSSFSGGVASGPVMALTG